MKKNVLILFLFFGFFTKAQYNLVPNPGFENYSNCPTGTAQMNKATPWINPTSAGNSDYYNRCDPFLNNIINLYQIPHSGNAYAAFYTYDSSFLNAREYIQTPLLSNMQNGSCYLVSYFVSRREKFRYATNNISAYFSNTAISLTGSTYLMSYPAQLNGFNKKIIEDTLNWVNIIGIYVANGSEMYLTLGNFENDINTNKKIINSNAIGTGAYYLIDDISVVPIDSIIGGMSAKAGVDKSIAIGDSAFIGQEISNLNCNWYQLPGNVQIATNTSGIYVKPTAPATYVVEQNLCGTVTYDTVFVMVSPTGIVSSNIVENNLKIYPNPTNSILNIIDSKKQLQNSTIEIKNYLGQVVLSSPFTSQINLSNLSVGMYFLTIQDKSNSKTIKIIKEE